MEAVRPRRIARDWIDGRELALIGTIPPRAEIHQPRRRILQLAGKAKHRHRAALRRAPRIVGDDAQRRRGRVEGAPHAAQRVGGVPGRGAAVERGQAVQAVDVVGGCGAADLGLQDLAERRGEILGVERRDAISCLRHQRAVAVVARRRRGAALPHAARAVQRVVGILVGTIIDQVTRRIICPADHLVGRVVVVVLQRQPVLPHVGAVTDQVVGVSVHRAGILGRARQAL